MVQPVSLLFLLTDTDILLAMKKRGFGVGRYNGVGGKPEPGETIEQTAVRECQEEIGVTPLELTQVADLTFYINYDNKHEEMRAAVYVSQSWEGEPMETEEMTPEWFSRDKVPYEQMWTDDIYWLPEVLKGNFVTASFTFDSNDKVVEKQIETRAIGS